MSRHFSRREFLGAAGAATLLPAITRGQRSPEKHEFPYVDGLCLYVLDKPEEIRASGLDGLVLDVSGGEAVKQPDGSPRYLRTFKTTSANMAAAREFLSKVTDAFIATDGKEIKKAFKSKKTAIFFQVQGGGEIVGEDLTRLDQLQKNGLRVFQLTHHHDNPLAG
ncbi:MAG TPA: membrane dipeptidase, partial [Pyrinomonadaceae bacterium]|nr:membrane dipeptidase [Pyrinomonadaceae bacterium]